MATQVLKPFGIVYGLLHPETYELRYVGQTTQTLVRRLSAHLAIRETSKTRHVARWLHKLKSEGLSPLIVQLAVAYSREELDSLEVEQIAKAKASGFRLTNHTEGGRGMSGFRRSTASRAKQSLSSKGRVVSATTRKKIGDGNRGLVRSVELVQHWACVKRVAKTLALLAAAPSAPAQKTYKVRPAYKAEKIAGQRHPQFNHSLSTESIIRDLNAGLSRKQVAAKYGTNVRLICKRLFQAERAGLQVPKSVRSSVIPTALILQELGKGLTRKQVAEALGISVGLIAIRLRQEHVNG